VIEYYKFAVSLAPVLALLAVLIYLDSFKLVSLRLVLQANLFGALTAMACMLVNARTFGWLGWDLVTFSRYAAPVIEEGAKAIHLVYLIRSRRVGFPVDAAIFGFALGAGFALAENIYYLQTLDTANILVWVVRGFGTAALHGATLVIFGIISKVLADRHPDRGVVVFLPGFLMAVGIHSIYNHFILPPVYSTMVLLVVLPVLVVIVFDKSERATRSWLGEGWNADVEMLESITTGEIGQTRVGGYLETLHDKFPGPVVADMLCLLRLHLELALEAKGLLLAREAGIRMPPDPEIKEKFTELGYLERNIGQTGLWALRPFLHTSPRDLWQRHMLGG
jgi:RsiW-degrading membrane proteinase PrsW (M82 family)